MTYRVQRVLAGHDELMQGMLTVFSQAFDDAEAYDQKRPSQQYLDRLLAGESFIALVAVEGSAVVGALAAYELRKFEQERSEIYIYDLAVAAAHRRQGVATALIEQVKVIAAARGAWVVFVQTEQDNAPAVALYSKLGTREDAAQFDIAVPAR